jgi:D-sedoheptulose 7-phosphate isomerase
MTMTVREMITAAQALLGAMLKDDALVAQVESAASLCIEALRKGGKIVLAGNGGSAADAQHIAAELVSRFNYDRPALAAIALTTDTSALTAIGNDYSFEYVFARQVEALGRAGDVLLALSTSGNSPNVLAALKAARAQGMKTIGLTGATGGKMVGLCDIAIKIPSAQTPRIQEGHIVIGHSICQVIEDTMFGEKHGKKSG